MKAWTRRARSRPGLVAHAALALTVYVPLLLTAPGRVGADTKTYLYLDPGRLLSRATSMWDPNVGLGTVTHQTIGYLWPIGPWYWAADAAGLPDWVAQRLWLGSILFGAGAGVLFLLRELGWRWTAATVSAFVYMLTPYSLTVAVRISVILLPFAGLPWMIAFTIRALRRRTWRDPALFALTVATVGGVNATALVFAGVAPLLWFPFAVWAAREATVRQAVGVGLRLGALTVATSLWWLSGLWAQGRYGIDILRYTETAKVVASASVAPEVLRGLGYWFFYGWDRLGPWIESGRAYTQRLWLLAVTYATPVLALAAAVITRWRHRAYFATLVAAGVLLSVGAYPWADPPPAGDLWQRFLVSDAGLALRSTPRAVPLSALGLAVLLGAGLTALAGWTARWARPAALGLVVLAVAGLPPLFTGGMVAGNLDRPETLPSYWYEMARHLDAGGPATRVLELPGSDFASYRWGNTVDPITPGLIDRPYVARELIPYGSPASADLLNALDRRIQENVFDTRALAPVIRLMGVGEIVARLDLQFERYRTPRPYMLVGLLDGAPGLDEPFTAGPVGTNRALATVPLLDELALTHATGVEYPPLAAYPVVDALPIVRAAPADTPVILAGDGEGVLNVASAGLIDGDELIRYAATLVPGASLPDGATLVVTDSNRRRGRRWTTVIDNVGYTEAAGETPLAVDLTDNRLPLFPDADDDSYTIAVHQGAVVARSTTYGNPISFTPENRAANAVDGDITSAWATAAFSDVRGERLELHFAEPVTTDHITVVQLTGERVNRRITDLDLVFDGGESVEHVRLDAQSGSLSGQELRFETRTFSRVDLVLQGDDIGPRRYWGDLSYVGFREVDVEGRRGDELIRVPRDLADDADHALAFSFERSRTDPANNLRSDEELTIVRLFSLGSPRSFAIAGTARLSARVADDQLDDLLGVGGAVARSSRRLSGDLGARASSAVDGDPATWWSPAFGLNALEGADWVEYRLPADTTFDGLELRVVADGRHSVPTRLRIEVDGAVVAVLDVPAIPDGPEADTVSEPITLPFPAVTGRTIRVVVEAVREVTTIDWYSDRPVRMPVGIAELGLAGVAVRPATGPFATGCRDDLVSIDGQPVAVEITGTVADAMSREPLAVRGCEPLRLGAGEHLLRTGDGRALGLDVDGLVLQSDAGGVAPTEVHLLIERSAPPPTVEVDHAGRTSYDLRASGHDGEPFWLVLGQSWNDGWVATAAGRDLGRPQLVDGYANGWLVSPADTGPVAITLEWRPQRVVMVAEWASLAGALGCLVLVLWPRRHPNRGTDDPVPALDPASLFGSGGRKPPLPASLVASGGVLVAGMLAIGILAGVIAGGVALLALRVRRARWVPALGAPLALAVAGLYIVAHQAHGHIPAAFEWPALQSAVHQVAWMAVAFLVVTVVVDWQWSRDVSRWRRPPPARDPA